MDMFKYRLVITGRLRGESGPEVEAAIKAGLTMTLPIHESVDSLTIETSSDMEELRRRFGDPMRKP